MGEGEVATSLVPYPSFVARCGNLGKLGEIPGRAGERKELMPN